VACDECTTTCCGNNLVYEASRGGYRLGVTDTEAPRPPRSWPTWLEPLLVAIVGFLSSGVVIVLSMPSVEDWCTFTEFGYLARIGPALAAMTMIAAAGVAAFVGLIGVIARRGGKLWLFLAGGLLAGALLLPPILEPRC
jgi:hypothetical protein